MSIINSINCISIFLLIDFNICLLVYYCSKIGLDILNTDDFIIQYFRNNDKCVLITEIIDMEKTNAFIKCYLKNPNIHNQLL